MSSPSAAGLGNPQVISVVPILRMYDVAATIRFYADYLGCSLDHQAGAGDRPVYLQVSRDGMQLHLSWWRPESGVNRRAWFPAS
jgi:catechol 2,3-dioxygenase-like lactoylglutathione lyase family enzyme